MKVFLEDDIAKALTPQVAIDALRQALNEQAAGLVQMPPRQTTDAGNDPAGLDKQHGANWLRISTAFLNGQGVMGFKAMNRAAGLGMRYLIGLYDIASGELLSMMDANEVTTSRTAATSALGTHLLAEPASRTVGILGTGVQARALLRCYAMLRDLDDVVVYSPTPASRDAFVRYAEADLGLTARAARTAEEVTSASTVLLAVRATREPVFFAEWLRPGMHVTGLSSVRYDAREVDDDTWSRADVVVVDDRVNVSHSGDAMSIASSGRFDIDHAAELYELHAGRVHRSGAEQITLFKSSGNAMQDVALAAAVYRELHDVGIGHDLDAFPAVKPYA